MTKPNFSKESTNKVVLSETLQHPMTLGFATLGIFGGAASALFSMGAIPGIIGVGGASLAVLSWLINYGFRREIFAAKHIRKLQEALDAHKKETVEKIQTELQILQGNPELAVYCQQGAEQFQRSKQRYDNLTNILKSKISTNELTYSRYQGTAEQVYMAILDNLLKVVHSLQSIRPIDGQYIEQRMKALAELPQKTEADEKEEQTLVDRRELRDGQIDLINRILTQNEEAMTMLDKTSAAIAQMNTGVSQSEQSLEEAMQDLAELAQRTSRY